MPNLRDRVIIDTNIWISFLLTNDFSKLDKIIESKEIVLIFSRELIEEFIEVSQRSKFKKYFDSDDVENLILKINSRAVIIEIISTVKICRDPKDDFLLSLAVDGNATHIITGDKDLLELVNYKKTRILTIANYLLDK